MSATSTGNRPPAGIDRRRRGDARASLLRQRDQLIAILLVDAEHRQLRLAVGGVEIGRAPDGGDDALVDRLARIDEDSGKRTRFHHVDHAARRRHAIGDDDLAGDVETGEVESIRPIIDGVLGNARRHIDQLSFDLLAIGRNRHRRRLGEIALAVGRGDSQRRRDRPGDEALWLVQCVRHTPLLEVADHDLERLSLFRRS